MSKKEKKQRNKRKRDKSLERAIKERLRKLSPTEVSTLKRLRTIAKKHGRKLSKTAIVKYWTKAKEMAAHAAMNYARKGKSYSLWRLVMRFYIQLLEGEKKMRKPPKKKYIDWP